MLSKSIQSIVGIFVGFAIGGLLGLVATPIAPATSTPRSGFMADVDREAQPAAVKLTAALGPTTTRGPRDDAVLPLTPAPPEAQTADPAPKPKPKSANPASTGPAASPPTQKAAPKPKQPKPKPAPRAPAPPPASNPPDPVIEAPAPAPKAEKPRPDKPPKDGRPTKPPKPPK